MEVYMKKMVFTLGLMINSSKDLNKSKSRGGPTLKNFKPLYLDFKYFKATSPEVDTFLHLLWSNPRFFRKFITVLFGLGAFVSKIYSFLDCSSLSSTLRDSLYNLIPLCRTPQISINNKSISLIIDLRPVLSKFTVMNEI